VSQSRSPRTLDDAYSSTISHMRMWWPWLFYQVCRCYRDTDSPQSGIRSSKPSSFTGLFRLLAYGLCQLRPASQLPGFQNVNVTLDAINTTHSLGKTSHETCSPTA
jgi:hypothetical protein